MIHLVIVRIFDLNGSAPVKPSSFMSKMILTNMEKANYINNQKRRMQLIMLFHQTNCIQHFKVIKPHLHIRFLGQTLLNITDLKI
jgi:hypothetical protein